jgi:hypothetical protein
MAGKIGQIVGAFLVTVVSASPSAPAEAPQNLMMQGSDGVSVQNGEKSASISFWRPTGGVTQIGLEHLDFSPSAYVTMITASGPTRQDAAMVAATLQTFTTLSQQSSFVDHESITFAYNQIKPTYVISELERAKLISPVEAQAARTAFYGLETRVNPDPTTQRR